MNIDLEVARTIMKEHKRVGKETAYELMVRKLQEELDTTKDKERRIQIETTMIFVLGMHQMTAGINRIATAIDNIAKNRP